jgi:DMSO/TMAO reductase YedYZ heme-binding membrane subunit
MNWIWIIIRVAGLAGYFLLTLSLLAGIYRHIPRKKGNILAFHQIIGQVALLYIGIHACLLLYDTYQPYTLKSILIPFTSPNEPILTGIGTIATFLLVIVIFTSDFMKEFGRSLWKKTHYLVFPLWILSAIHGLFLGTDSQTIWAEVLYLSTALMVVLSTLYLVVLMNKKKPANLKA